MIGGATSGTGGGALGRHLADIKGHNVRTEMGESRHLGAETIQEAVAELTQTLAGSASSKPLYHMHADPSPFERFDDAKWSDYWQRMERELGLSEQPFVEARHWTWRTVEAAEATPENLDLARSIHGPDKVRELPEGGFQVLMDHRHRGYSRQREDGSLIRMSHDHARREKIHREFEFDHGFDLTKGAHNRAAAAALKAQGRADVVAAMEAARLLDGPRPRAKTTPMERAQQERTGIQKADVETMARSAWASADNPKAREAAFAAAGFALAFGRDGKTPVLIDAAGGVHGLRRILGLKAKDAAAAIDGLKLPTAAAVQTAIRDAAKSPLNGCASKEKTADDNGPTTVDRQAVDTEGRVHGSKEQGTGGRNQRRYPAYHRDADRTREGEGAESSRRDSGNPRKDERVFERPRNASRLDRIHARAAEARFVQAGHGPRLQSLADKLKATTAQPVQSVAQTRSAAPEKSAIKSGGAPSAVGRSGSGGGGSFGGGGSGKSMEAALHANTGWIEAPELSGSGDGAPIADGGDSEEMAKAAETFTEAMTKLWRQFFGGKSVSPPSPKVSAPPPPGGGTGDAEASRAVAAEAKSEPPTDPATELGRDLAAYLRKVNAGTIKDGQKLANKLDRNPAGKKLRETIDAMHGSNELLEFAKRLPRSTPPSEIIRCIEEEADRLKREREERANNQNRTDDHQVSQGPQERGSFCDAMLTISNNMLY